VVYTFPVDPAQTDEGPVIVITPEGAKSITVVLLELAPSSYPTKGFPEPSIARLVKFETPDENPALPTMDQLDPSNFMTEAL
jgi:hypothetical protein